jgi:hypothetical protein
MSQRSSNRHPPKPRLALAVGIIGHRPNRLPDAAREKVAVEVERFFDELTEAAKAAQAKHAEVFDPGPPVLSLVSPLAEGADRIAADFALKAGFNLDVPMPFSQPAYEQDFADEVSLGEFRGFLERARSVLALPGDRGSENRAYEAVGLTVLGQSDILLVIWDGGASAGRGGTTEMIQTAIQSGLPIVNVDANGQAPTKIMWQRLVGLPVPVEAIEELHTVGLQELPGIVDALLRLPSEPAERKSLMRYLGESRNFRWMRPEFPLLQGAARARPFSRTDFNPPNPETLATDFAATFAERRNPGTPASLRRAMAGPMGSASTTLRRSVAPSS